MWWSGPQNLTNDGPSLERWWLMFDFGSQGPEGKTVGLTVVMLLDGTIAENISYGRPNTERTKMERAARSAGAGFVNDLPQGLETLVGPRGLSLSAGERQRIGIARALAREPDILILDEATNAIDHETETGIVQALQNLPESMTIIVISHRPSTVAFCDDAVVLNRGRVVETGPLSSVFSYRTMEAGIAGDTE